MAIGEIRARAPLEASPTLRAAGSGPVAEIGELLARKPDARVAIVQGSFDWFHSGHLSLVSNVAGAKLPGTKGGAAKPFDLVVVIPTFEYDRKPYLRNSYDRRLELARQAIATRPELAGRVLVSDAQRPVNGGKGLATDPGPMMKEIVGAYSKAFPKARFAYCLGGDSFDQSADHGHWREFDFVENHPKVDLIAVERGGYEIQGKKRARTVLDLEQTTISSTEIRRALNNGDLESVRARVPPATYRALEEELRRREADFFRAGARLIGVQGPSEQSFSALRKAVPKGAPDLLDLVEEKDVPEDVRVHLATVQELINRRAAELENLDFSVSSQQMDPKRGYSDKLILDARSGLHLQGRFLHKPLDREAAAKVEFVSVLSNLVGMPTALALTHDFKEPGAKFTASHGVTVRLVDDLVEAEARGQRYDFSKAPPKVLEYLMVSRWLNQVVGNLDVWWGQFMVPRDPKKRYTEMLNIDLDEAFNTFAPELMKEVLETHWKFENVNIEDCKWRAQPFEFERPAGFAPGHYDSKATFYAPLLRDYVQGKVDLDIDRIKEQVRFANKIPRAAVLNAMRKFLEASKAKYKNWWVEIPGAERSKISRADFERLFVARLERSVEEYCGFLDELKSARADPESPIRKHFDQIDARAY